MKQSPIEAADQFIDDQFPHSSVVLLGGSSGRGEETPFSELDLVIIDPTISYAYRESFEVLGWMIETFVYNQSSYLDYFQIGYETANPSLLRMCIEGKVIRDDGFANQLKKEAEEWYQRGPKALTEEDVLQFRYRITDLLDDVAGAQVPEEALCAVQALFPLVAEFLLRMNGYWNGKSKWLFRRLQQLDHRLGKKYVKIFEDYYISKQEQPFIHGMEELIEPFGGRLFAGFALGKEQVSQTE
ncbi:nucleotidyltransferase domain-containing protein [Hazenella coriacea]|uniref:Nucleotidyltransferase-like protein n=1 Tax=Hazenella coriacea TaxID=1179467 RepID=A0A4R3L588_9BACL|nr:nucleotidyltransferase domain-containing protein [Hazenella coriacea]TCS94789.1 hypothetical protein EDD58_103209 [Hazenella coriacea]